MTSAHILEHDARHRYQCTNPAHKGQPCDGKIFQSVTTILGKAVPKNLAWHGQTRGVIGVKGLLKRQYDIARMSPDAITEALKRERLTVNDHMKEAGAGGDAVHKALEHYIKRGVIPSAQDVPESKRASMRGLARFIMDYRPEFTASEVRILSLAHGYAGTFDFLAHIHAETYVERGILKLRPATSRLFVLGDMKNSRWVYPAQHFAQLAAYEGGRLEAGEPPTDLQCVLWLNQDGGMELVPSTATLDDFLALKSSAESIERLDKSWRRPRKVRG